MSISEFSRRQVPRAAPLTLVLCLQSAPLSAYVSGTPARPDAPADERPEMDRARRYGAPRPPDEPLPPDVERERPDYDGRPEPPPSASEVLLWVPRIALFPAYLLSEYVVRRPLGFVVTEAERAEVPVILHRMFTFGTYSRVGLVPTTLLDFGFRPSIGAYFFFNDLLVEQNDFRAQIGWGGSDWWLGRLADRIYPAPGHELGVEARFLQRPDWVFHGVGPHSRDSDLGRYRSTWRSAQLYYYAEGWHSSSAFLQTGLRSVSFDAGIGCCSDASLADKIEAGAYPEPLGLSGYDVVSTELALVLDSRPLRNPPDLPEASDHFPSPGSGVRLAVRGHHSVGIDERPPVSGAEAKRYNWVRYGATLGGYIDLTGLQRVVGLSLIADFVDPVRPGGAIPFTELVQLGGSGPMRGFLDGRLMDRSSIVGRLSYHWPIWVWIDGVLSYDVGNVFGKHLSGFDFDDLRSSISLGVSSIESREGPFEALIGVGTRTFGEGHGIDNVRLVFGSSTGL